MVADRDGPDEPTMPSRLARWTPHLGTGLSLGYLTMIAVGMFHNFALFYRFGINVLDFAEPSDFLLAPLRDPLVMVATILPAVVIFGSLISLQGWSDRQWRRRRGAGLPVAWWETNYETMPRARRFSRVSRVVAALLWVLASSLWYERYAATRIMMGDGLRVSVETTTNVTEQGTERRPVMLLGTTGRFVFLFRTEDWRTVILPAENILRIIPAALARGSKSIRPRLIKAMDSTPPAATP